MDEFRLELVENASKQVLDEEDQANAETDADHDRDDRDQGVEHLTGPIQH
jgi:hypothetical protein